MDLFWAIIYGLLQGLTEFLPVSSSAHLALLPRFFNFTDPGVHFDLAMHIGTAGAVIVYFYKDLQEILKPTLQNKISFKISDHHPMFLNLLIAVIGTILMVIPLKDVAFSFGRNSFFMGINLIVFGILMAVSDKFFKEDLSQDFFSKTIFKKAFFIGIAQAIAIFPGVSRSGATLSMARFLNIERVKAARFSFLLSMPIIILGGLWDLKEIILEKSDFPIIYSLVGMGASFLSGLVAIKILLSLVSKIGLIPFSIYRILFGAFILYTL